MDDSLDDFLDMLGERKPESESPKKTPKAAKFEGTGDDIKAFLPPPPPPPRALDTIAARTEALQSAFPNATAGRVSELAEEASDDVIAFIVDPKRPHRERALFELVLAHGFVTAKMLAQVVRPDGQTGYKEVAPRDIRKAGIVFDTRWVNGETRYYLNVSESNTRLGGPDHISPELRRQVFERDNFTCGLCLQPYGSTGLNPDHMIPHRVAGRTSLTVNDLWTLCLSCNRKKQKACRTCPNQNGSPVADRDCRSCLFSGPSTHTHVATKAERHVSFVARTDAELEALGQVEALARSLGLGSSMT